MNHLSGKAFNLIYANLALLGFLIPRRQLESEMIIKHAISKHAGSQI